MNVYLSQKTLFEIAERTDISEEDFCKQNEFHRRNKKIK